MPSGCAGLYGLKTVPAPVDADGYTLDLDGLRALARGVEAKDHHGGRRR